MDTSENTKVLASRADVQTNLFLNPPETRSSGPDNSEWILGTTQHIRWSTDFSNFDFFLYQQLACGDHSCVNGPFLIAGKWTQLGGQDSELTGHRKSHQRDEDLGLAGDYGNFDAEANQHILPADDRCE